MQDRGSAFDAQRAPSSPRAVLPTGTKELSLRGFVLRLWLGLVSVNLLVIVLVIWALEQSREQYEEAAVIQASNLAQLLDHDFATNIRSIDRSLQLASQFVARQLAAGRLDTPAFNTFFERKMFQLSVLNGLCYADSAGHITHAVGTDVAARMSIADRDYFVRLHADPHLDLQISRPAPGRLTGQWGLYLARAVRLPDGRFAGVVVASLPLDYVNRTVASLALGSSGSIGLLDGELRVIARRPQIAGGPLVSGTLTGSAALRESVAAHPREGSYSTRSAIDGVTRRDAYRRLGELPLYVVVGLAGSDSLATWKQDATKAWGLAALFMLMTLGLGSFLHCSWRRQSATVAALGQAYRTLEAGKQLNQTIIQCSPFAIYTRDRHGIVTAWNPAAEKLFG